MRYVALVALGALEAVSAASALRGERSGLAAFASTFTPVSSVKGAMSTCSLISPFLELKAGPVSLDELTEGANGLTMGCRRNLKKEKRLRNETCARKFRKPKPRFGGRPPMGAKKEDNGDSLWLEQIYGQHTIYRRDQPDEVERRAKGLAQQEERKEKKEAVVA